MSDQSPRAQSCFGFLEAEVEISPSFWSVDYEQKEKSYRPKKQVHHLSAAAGSRIPTLEWWLCKAKVKPPNQRSFF